MSTIKTEELQLSTRHTGGFLYSRECYGLVTHPDGMEYPIPYTLVGTRDIISSRKEGLEILTAAPVGSLYEVTEYPDEDQDFEEQMLCYRKVSHDSWAVLFWVYAGQNT